MQRNRYLVSAFQFWASISLANVFSWLDTTNGTSGQAWIAMVGFVEAVRKKYEYKGTEAEEGGDLVGGAKTGRKQALDILERVFMPAAGISDAGADGEIAAICGAIKELDLEDNSLSDWSPVLAIASQLAGLHWLGLNGLPLAPLAALPETFTSALGGLGSLCLNRTGMEWAQLLFLAKAMPALHELHFNGNGVTSTAHPEGDALPLGWYRIESNRFFRRSSPARLSSARPWARVDSPRWGLRFLGW